jgi:hypothetical protein
MMRSWANRRGRSTLSHLHFPGHPDAPIPPSLERLCFADATFSDFYGGWVTSNIQGKMKGGRSHPSADRLCQCGIS